jgi:hypothetical protein
MSDGRFRLVQNARLDRLASVRAAHPDAVWSWVTCGPRPTQGGCRAPCTEPGSKTPPAKWGTTTPFTIRALKSDADAMEVRKVDEVTETEDGTEWKRVICAQG